jgi:hypothetical protein
MRANQQFAVQSLMQIATGSGHTSKRPETEGSDVRLPDDVSTTIQPRLYFADPALSKCRMSLPFDHRTHCPKQTNGLSIRLQEQ